MENKLKVAVFNTQPPHLYNGGVERRILENANKLQKKVDTTVYSGTKRGFTETVKINGGVIVPCHSTDSLFPLDNWVFNRSIAKMSAKIETNIYEAHNVSGYKLQKSLKKNRSSKPFIQVVHGVLADEYIQASKSSASFRTKLSNLFMWNLGRIEKEAAKQATIVVTVSRYSASKIVELYGVEENKIKVVPNGVDTQRFKPAKDCEELEKKVRRDKKHVVLFVGNLIPRKGLHYLIEAAKQVLKEHKETQFVVAGEGPLKNKLISYTKHQGVRSNFTFLGRIPEADINGLYNCADVFASPSIQEGQGITLLEAQATAKPVVAFNVSAIKEVVKNKETGLLVEPNSTELAKGISSLLSDRGLREKMGNSARQFVSDNFSWDICADKMFQIYLQVTET
jgi:glycosyltransferase involved in cell wall biosynthesis